MDATTNTLWVYFRAQTAMHFTGGTQSSQTDFNACQLHPHRPAWFHLCQHLEAHSSGHLLPSASHESNFIFWFLLQAKQPPFLTQSAFKQTNNQLFNTSELQNDWQMWCLSVLRPSKMSMASTSVAEIVGNLVLLKWKWLQNYIFGQYAHYTGAMLIDVPAGHRQCE